MVTTTNLISYYKMDESSGALIDSHSSNDSTGVNNLTYSQTGILNDAIDFNGTNSYANFGDVAAFEGGHIAISLWVAGDSPANFSSMIFKKTGTTGYALITDSGKFRFDYKAGANAVTLTSTTSISTDGTTEQHVMFTYDGTTGRLSINGTEEDSSTVASGNMVTNSENFVLGNHSNLTSSPFDGTINNVGIWSEVQAGMASDLYNGGSGFAYPFTNDVIISPSAFTLSTSEQAPSLFIDISQSAVFALTAGLPTPMFDAPMPFNRGTVGTQDIATRFPLVEGLIARTTKQTVNPNLEAKEKGSF